MSYTSASVTFKYGANQNHVNRQGLPPVLQQTGFKEERFSKRAESSKSSESDRDDGASNNPSAARLRKDPPEAYNFDAKTSVEIDKDVIDASKVGQHPAPIQKAEVPSALKRSGI